MIRCEVANDRLIEFEFDNGITMHLEDSSDQFECMQISFEGDRTWIIYSNQYNNPMQLTAFVRC